MTVAINEDDSATRVFVSGLPPTLTGDQLRSHFTTKFSVTDAHVFPNRRIGFVGFNNHEDARKASKYFNKSFLRMSKISVDLAKPVEIKRDSNGQTTPVSEQSHKYTFNSSRKRKRGSSAEDENTINGGKDVASKGKRKFGAEKDIQGQHNESQQIQELGHASKDSHLLEESADHKKASLGDLNNSPDHDQSATIVERSDADWLRGKTSRVLEFAELDEIELSNQKNTEDITSSSSVDQPPEKIVEMDSPSNRLNEENTTPKISNARLFIRNLPFDASADELQALFMTCGKVSEVHIVKDTKTSKSKGLGFVQFVEPKDAEKAIQELDGKSFQGRLLHILPASDKRIQKLNDYEISKLPLKKQQALKRKAEAATSTFSWNSLYMNPDAVLASVANRLQVSKAELLDPTSTESSVKQAHAETSVIEETKQYLRSNGVNVDAFKNSKRDDKTLLLKNFTFGTTIEELTDMLLPFGKIQKCIFPSTGTMAIVRYEEAHSTTQALKRLAYRNLRGSPLFLERAPEGLFDPIRTEGDARTTTTKDEASLKEDPQPSTGGSYAIFVRNLNFSTSGARLAEIFKPLSGFLSARVKTRTDPSRPREVLSMGFGFVEFRTKEQAEAAVKTMNGHVVDGHDLQVQISHKSNNAAEERRKEDVANKGNAHKTKIIIKNLPFEASKKDIQALFGPYGQLRSVRMPKKFNSSARGFAFADFITSKEAGNAIEALSNTHLLGRRLVLEFAEAENVDPEEEIKAMEKKVGHQVHLNTLNKMMKGSTRRKFDINAREDEGEV